MNQLAVDDQCFVHGTAYDNINGRGCTIVEISSSAALADIGLALPVEVPVGNLCQIPDLRPFVDRQAASGAEEIMVAADTFLSGATDHFFPTPKYSEPLREGYKIWLYNFMKKGVESGVINEFPVH